MIESMYRYIYRSKYVTLQSWATDQQTKELLIGTGVGEGKESWLGFRFTTNGIFSSLDAIDVRVEGEDKFFWQDDGGRVRRAYEGTMWFFFGGLFLRAVRELDNGGY